jgi:4-aminobutyrate aminotransferase-like enzyme
VNALGHAHPRVVKVIRREAARAIHLSNLFHNASRNGPGWTASFFPIAARKRSTAR